ASSPSSRWTRRSPALAAASATKARTPPTRCCAWPRCGASSALDAMAGAPLRPGDPGPGTFAGGAAVNLFSDTQTRPSPAMRAAMAAAEVGDEQRFADPTTTELERRVADLL